MEHKELTNRLYKVAILNDILQAELTNIKLEQILNSELASKLRNMKKSSDVFSKYIDTTFNQLEVSEAFGGLCDIVNEFIDVTLKPIIKE